MALMGTASAGFTPDYTTTQPRNAFEDWHLPVRTYLVDDYRKSFECHGMAQYCKGGRGDGFCGYKYTDGSIACYHSLFHNTERWSHDGHSYCNCQDLTCKSGSRRFSQASPDNIGCQKTSGKWVVAMTNTAPQTLQIAQGFTKSTSWMWSNSQEFSQSVTTSVKEGFEAEGVSASVGVDSTTGSKIASSQSTSWSIQYDQTKTYTFGPYNAGVVWRWQWDITGTFGNSIIHTFSLANTTNSQHPPCCLPGMLKDASNPRGACSAGPNLCSQDMIV